jgi:hypothetical protein
MTARQPLGTAIRYDTGFSRQVGLAVFSRAPDDGTEACAGEIMICDECRLPRLIAWGRP